MESHVDSESVLLKCNAIVANVEAEGLYRYDPADFRNMEFISRRGVLNLLLRKIILGFELFAPITMRKIFHIEKSLHATSFYHLGMAYLMAEKYGIEFCTNKTSRQICKEMIDAYIIEKGEDIYWGYPYSNSFFYSSEKDIDMFTMPMHGLARLNTMLLLVGRQYDNDDLIDISVKSIITTLKQHTLTAYPDGSISISYCCNSDDVTLNICSEFACWLSLVPGNMRTQEMTEIINGIVKLMISEQRQDGSWDYFGNEHHKKWGGQETIDCHHTATNLTTLITILENEDALHPEVEVGLIESCNLGMKFFINNFFDQDGSGIEIYGRKRPAGSVQYAETVFALCKYLNSDQCTDLAVHDHILNLLPKIVNRMGRFVKQDGTVPSGIYYDKPYCLQSLRWGSAPVLQAFMTYLALQK